ncbi:CoA-binding protein [Patescibacteria group bacterium]
MKPKDFINHSYHYAVVGATTNQSKYGYQVLMDLNDGDYQVVGVNPKYNEIEGISVYPSLKEVPNMPDVAVAVVPPEVGLKIIDEAKLLGIKKMWFQPGAESEAIRQKCVANGILAMASGACIMIERSKL